MSNSPKPAGVRAPTPFPDLDAVLAVLVEGAQSRLGEVFVGAYLQGSFAVGDADVNSDCDFIVAIRRDLTSGEIAALDDLHGQIHQLPYVPWRHRLEGSYVPVELLRRASPDPRDPPGEAPRPPGWRDPGLASKGPAVYPYVYLDHGAQNLVRSEHDKTNIVRWCLREKGIVLRGPDPRRLVDPVSPEMLRAEVRANMDLCLDLGLEPMHAVAWQAFWVILFCRMLHTLVTGRVASKKAGAAWASAHLDPRWRALILRSQAERAGDIAARMAPPDPADVAATRAFAAWAIEFADHAEETRRLLARQILARRSGGPGAMNAPSDPRVSPTARRSQFTPPPTRPGGRGRRG